MACQLFGHGLRQGRRPQCGFLGRMLKAFKGMAGHVEDYSVVIAVHVYYAADLERRLVTEKLSFEEV